MPDEMPEHEQGEIVDIVIEDERWEDVDLLGMSRRAAHATGEWLGLEGFQIVVMGCDDDRIAGLNAEGLSGIGLRAALIPELRVAGIIGCGAHGGSSLLRFGASAAGGLFVTEGVDGILPCCSHGRNGAGQERNDHHGQDDQDGLDRVEKEQIQAG